MKKKNIYKLYHVENGYKCKVNLKELVFLFGVNAAAPDPAAINQYLKIYNYYVEL